MFNVGYDERRVVLALLREARAKDRVQALAEVINKCIEVQPCLHVIEGNLTCIVIQEDSDLTRKGLHHQRQAGRGQSFHLPVFQPQAPEAALGTQLDLALPAGRSAGHAERPGRLASHVHLPVVSPGADALSPQDEEGWAEPIRTLRVGRLALFVSHLPTVIGHDQVSLGRGRIQNHLAWRGQRVNFMLLNWQHTHGSISSLLRRNGSILWTFWGIVKLVFKHKPHTSTKLPHVMCYSLE